MKNKDMPAFPVEVMHRSDGSIYGVQTGNQIGFEIGLTKREMIAGLMDARAGIAEYSLDYLESLVGRERPSASTTAEELLKWDAACEAKIKVIKADALLLELSNPQP